MFIPKSLQLNPAEGILEGCSYGDVVIETVLALLMRSPYWIKPGDQDSIPNFITELMGHLQNREIIEICSYVFSSYKLPCRQIATSQIQFYGDQVKILGLVLMMTWNSHNIFHQQIF